MPSRSAAIFFLLIACWAYSSRAQSDLTAEAREHYQSALRFVDEEAWEQAAAELERAYQLAPRPVVLYNMGETYAAAGRPVEALDAFERYLALETSLPEERRKHVEEQIERQKRRVGLLVIEAPAGSSISIDGKLLGRAPLGRDVRVAIGRHVVVSSLPGHKDGEQVVTLGSGEKRTLGLVLEPLEPKATGKVAFTCRVAAVKVSVDGKPRGTTPLPGPFELFAGEHEVRFSRAGYTSRERSIVVGARRKIRVDCGLLPLDPLPPSLSGKLQVRPSETGARVFVDGLPWNGEPLPLDVHDLEIEREGFRAWRRSVRLEPGSSLLVDAKLSPTPEHAQAYRSAARTRMSWGIAFGAAGVALGGAALGTAIWSSGRYQNYQSEQRALDARWPSASSSDPELRRRQRDNDALLDSIQTWDRVALGMAATGGLLGASGAWLYFGAPDPERYTRAR